MSSWEEIERSEPDFAHRVRKRLDAYRHKVVATLREDGSPRISGIEAEFKEGQVSVGMMAGSVKARDLKHDPRLALHSGTEDPKEQPGEVIDAKLAGIAREVPGTDHHVFHIDVKEVVLVAIGDPPDHLVIEAWHEDRGLTSTKRH